MKVVIRADASAGIGSGHVMRCLALADELSRQGAGQVAFLCRDLPGNLNQTILASGHRLTVLPNDETWTVSADALACLASIETTSDWLIVDHYELDSVWESTLRQFVGRVFAIDDLGRKHDCDLLLDQNLESAIHELYAERVPYGCKKLLGPRYALLRQQFGAARVNRAKKDGPVRRVLVFFGGGDAVGPLLMTLGALRQLGGSAVAVDVVLGRSDRVAVENACRDMRGVALHDRVENMAHLMARADLAIGAGGSSTWERCCMGLPALTISLADNQDAIAGQAEKIGLSWHLGRVEHLTVEELGLAIGKLVDDAGARFRMSQSGLALVDGMGTARVVQAMREI